MGYSVLNDHFLPENCGEKAIFFLVKKISCPVAMTNQSTRNQFHIVSAKPIDCLSGNFSVDVVFVMAVSTFKCCGYFTFK